jgi:hypothetical protein
MNDCFRGGKSNGAARAYITQVMGCGNEQVIGTDYLEGVKIFIVISYERDTSTSLRLSINGMSSGVSRFESTIFIEFNRSNNRAFRIRFNQTIVDIVT